MASFDLNYGLINLPSLQIPQSPGIPNFGANRPPTFMDQIKDLAASVSTASGAKGGQSPKGAAEGSGEAPDQGVSAKQ